ncbi:unknown [Prevotella sp. CAG:1058]|nr:unknown [Prevotella sp. CAG:1058]
MHPVPAMAGRQRVTMSHGLVNMKPIFIILYAHVLKKIK